MKKLLILYPHFPPSNLAGVHRPRLFANHLAEFGWEPVVLTVHEDFYEENLDWNLAKLIDPNLRIEKVKAFPVTKPRVIGDIGLRGFMQLYKRGKQLISSESIDMVYIPIPSFYCALIGRLLNYSTRVKYCIDYIDPWVHEFPGSNLLFSRHWFSSRLAKLLEPIALKKASLVIGVAEGYYKAVLDRNPHLNTTAIVGAMPYGGEAADHAILEELGLNAELFKKVAGKIQLVYAGAMLPKAYQPLEAIFKAIAANVRMFGNLELHFIGTGSKANDDRSYNIKPLAEKYGIYNSIVFEYPKRIPYLEVLTHLKHADGVFILGSTEPHYTPSKVYQAVLAQQPIMAVLHEASTAVKVIRDSNTGIVLSFDGEQGIDKVENQFGVIWNAYQHFKSNYNPDLIDQKAFNEYSANEVTRQLVKLMNRVT